MQQLSGVVTAVKTKQTATVVVVRRWINQLYHKTVTRKKPYLVHCEIDVAVGAKVLLVPIRPISKRKRWKVLKVVK